MGDLVDLGDSENFRTDLMPEDRSRPEASTVDLQLALDTAHRASNPSCPLGGIWLHIDMSVDQVGIGIEIEILFPDLRYLVGILVYILVKCVENSLTLKFHHDQAPGS